MAEFKSFEPGIEVSGIVILALIEAMGDYKDRGYEILDNHGLSNIEQTGWYSLQDWLDAFKTIYEHIGPVTLKMIGVKLAQMQKQEPGVDSIEQAFEIMNVMYHLMHRKDGKIMYNEKTGKMEEGIGGYKVERIGDRSMKIICNNPYPDVFEQGGLESLACRYKPKDSLIIKVVHADNAECKRKGGDSCTYIVSW